MFWVFLEYNYALSTNATQKNTYEHTGTLLTANLAIDGSLNTYSVATDDYRSSFQWWIVDLDHRILFKAAYVYVRGGVCGSSSIECCK